MTTYVKILSLKELDRGFLLTDLAAARLATTLSSTAAELGWLLLDAAFRKACSVGTAPIVAGFSVGVAFNPLCVKSARLFIITPLHYLSAGGLFAPSSQIIVIMTRAYR